MGVYRDLSLAIYSSNGVNVDSFPRLIQEVQGRRLVYPVLIDPVSLDLDEATGEYKLSDNDRFITSGDEAREELKKFDHKAGSGVRGLNRYSSGDWDAGWDRPFDSDAGGRVDWKRDEVAAKNLEADVLKEIEKESEINARDYLADLERRKQQALDLVRGKQ